MSAEILQARTPAEISLATVFDDSKARLPGTARVAKYREDSFSVFKASGLPHRRIEAWHYTDLRALMRNALPIAALPTAAIIDGLHEKLAATAPAQRLVLVDGFFVPQLSSNLPEGIRVRPLTSVLNEGQPDLIALLSSQDLAGRDSVVALNAALMQDGVVIEVAPQVVIAEPLYLIHVVASPTAHFTRSAVIVGAGASLRLAEMHHRGVEGGQANACLIVSVGEGASLGHAVGATGPAAQSMRLETIMARVGASAKFDSFALVSGIGLIRRQIFLRFEGIGASASLTGVALLGGREHADTTLHVEHAAQGCVSRETFNYILDEEATGIFQGKIRVAPGAQKTDGKMLSRAILLSDKAAMNNKPELEIFADDVACGHGATCGSLDSEQLFYLQTRGLPLPEAEALLLEAFAAEVIDSIGHDALIDVFRQKVKAWLSGRHPVMAAPAKTGSKA